MDNTTLETTPKVYPSSLRVTKKAFKMNGVYLENVIKGYHTINVSGREPLGVEFKELSNTIRDGSVIRGRRYPTRTIKVGYLIYLEGIENPERELLRKRDELMRVLQVKDAKLIFDDENDKYFIGTPGKDPECSLGLGCITGQINFYCTDPFKYDVDLTMVDGRTESKSFTDIDGNTVTEQYNVYTTTNMGSYTAYPEFQVNIPEDKKSGYILFSKGDYSIQIGDDESDQDTGSATKQADYDFTSGMSGWTTSSNKSISAGIMTTSDIADRANWNASNNGTAKSVITGNGKGLKFNATNHTKPYFSGPLLTKDFTSPLSDEFTISFNLIFQDYSGDGNHYTGAFGLYLLGGLSGNIYNGYKTFGFIIKKYSTSSSDGYIEFYEGERDYDAMSTYAFYDRPFGSEDPLGYSDYANKVPRLQKCTIQRTVFGKTTEGYKKYRTTFSLPGNITKSFEEIMRSETDKPLAFTTLGLYFGRDNSTTATRSKVLDARLTNLKVYNGGIVFPMNGGDAVVIDTQKASISINGTERAELGDITNDWDGMVLEPGVPTSIFAQWNSWAGLNPTTDVKVGYRKRYL